MQNYELQGVIGQGQYGVAHRARHRLDGQLYCIKRIPMSAKDGAADALKEVQLLSQLDHPNIIGYKESFIDKSDGALCIVTSFCEEGDLFNKIRKRAAGNQLFTEEEVMDMFVQIAAGLMHIHSKRILHRDLKTQNIFVARGGIMKLGDFGISKVLEKTDQFATTVTGTPYYMAPEICTNQPYTFKSDIWSLGCVLYELCSLKHAFAADSLLSLVYQIVRGNFPPIGAHFSPGLHALVNALLVRDAAQRPSLIEIFKIPYVADHMHRYSSQMKGDLMRMTTTRARRQQLLDKAQGGGSDRGSDVGANGGGADGLTAKERLARKKEAERAQYEMELKLAHMSLQKDRETAAQRKMAMVHGSNTGLPGAVSLPVAGSPGMEGGDMGGANAISAPAMNRMSSLKRGGEKNPWNAVDDAPAPSGRGGVTMGMDGSFVNMDTMPAHAGSMMPAGTGQRMQAGNRTLQDDYDNRPIRPGSRPGGGRPVNPGYEDDTVLMGTVAGGGNTMVNMGTVNMGGQGTINARTASANNPWALHDAAPVRQPSPPNVVGGFKFGITNPGQMPALPVFPAPANRNQTPSPIRSQSPPVADKVKFGISSDSRPRGSFEYVVKDANAQRGYDDYDEGGDEYPDDFEDYSPADDQDTINQKVKILSQMEDLERSGPEGWGVDDTALAQVRDKVGAGTKSSKAQALRDKCQAALGVHFAQVYAYLRQTRNLADSGQVDEVVVQRHLSDLVGGDRALIQGCFLVDQLVFQEMMYR
uniref:non-specific serine/threonine protein kinase n=1 Tax=Chlamydomonas leiostraca TaxID=1034604 RepID=A0A7S0R2F9_9CHLO|mmetsp:Transcript_12241/g.29843  ORF Transcript_12241/g.29843 Transcript_12241/m.29843 type:complete len:756 (+) Transcript_12241:105-2372(+)